MKIYQTIIDNGNGTYVTCHGSAKNAKEFAEMYGEGMTKPKNVTGEFFVSPRETRMPGYDSVTNLIDTLIHNGWGEVEARFIGDLLDEELKKQGR